MLKIKFLLCFVLLLDASILYSQVSPQTGASEFKIPMFSFSDPNRLHTSVSLEYIDGNGLKVNEVGSCVGTGWNIKAGGVIVREQRGLPDDQQRATPYANPLPENTYMTQQEYLGNMFPQGFLSSAFSPTDAITNEAGFVRKGVIAQQFPIQMVDYNQVAPVKEFFSADREQDIFHLSFNDKSVDFIIERNGQISILNDSKVKIEPVFGTMLALKIKTWFTKFIVTDLDGLKYTFSDKELSEELTYDTKRQVSSSGGTINLDPNAQTTFSWSNIHYTNSNSSPNSNAAIVVFLGKPTGNFIVSKWYLSEILNPLTQDKISFVYENYDLDMNTDRSISYFNTPSVVINRERLKAVRLKEINCPNLTQAQFIYETIARADAPAIKPIKEIVIKEKDVFTNKFVFQYQYFTRDNDVTSIVVPYDHSFTGNQQSFSRLSLKSVQKKGIGVIAENPHQFEYFINDQTPAAIPVMFSLWTDHWGYSNNLHQITLPTGGFTREYEVPLNVIPSWSVLQTQSVNAQAKKVPYDGLAKFGILKKVTYPLGGALSFEYEQNTAFFNSQNILSGGVRVSKTMLYDGIDHGKDIINEYKYLKDDGISSSGWGYEIKNYTRPADYRIYKFAAEDGMTTSNYAAQAKSMITAGIKNSIVSGTSVLMEAYNSLQFGIVVIMINAIINALSAPPPLYTEDTGIQYNNFSLTDKNPLPFQYSRVEVIEKKIGQTPDNNGKTVYSYTSPDDLSLKVAVLNSPYSYKPRLASSYYGLPKDVAIFDNTGFKLKETLNDFELKEQNGSMSKSWIANKSIYDRYPSSQLPYLNDNTNINSESYYSLLNHTDLKSTKERTFSKTSSGTFAETERLYTYNTANNQIKVESFFNSKGSLIENKYYYPSDYNLTSLPALQSLIANNLNSLPVSTEIWQTKIGGSAELISLTVNEFGITSNGDIKPFKSYGLETEKPISLSLIGAFDPTQLIRNTSYIKPQKEIIYNSWGDLLSIKDITKNTTNSIIYNTERRPVATVTNALSSQIAYASFEENIEVNGNVESLPFILSEQCPMGLRCGELRDGAFIRFANPVSTESILSFWATSNDIQLNGNPASPAITGPTVNGWTFYEFNIPVSSSVLVISGTFKIDELRLYPKNARMSTAFFITGKGKVSESDFNNKIFYYNYDGLGRVIEILDEKRNLVKTFEYHLKTQP